MLDLREQGVLDLAVEFLGPAQVVDEDFTGRQSRTDLFALETTTTHGLTQRIDGPTLPTGGSGGDIGGPIDVLPRNQHRFFRAIRQLRELQAIVAQVHPDQM